MQYRAEKTSLHVLLSNSQEGPGRNFSRPLANFFVRLCAVIMRQKRTHNCKLEITCDPKMILLCCNKYAQTCDEGEFSNSDRKQGELIPDDKLISFTMSVSPRSQQNRVFDYLDGLTNPIECLRASCLLSLSPAWSLNRKLI